MLFIGRPFALEVRGRCLDARRSGKPCPSDVGRPHGVAHLPEIERYAMFIQHGPRVLIALADNPLGPFTWDREIDMTSRIGTSNTGDQTVFTDEDTGRSYLIYSYGRGRNRIYVSEIGVRDGQSTCWIARRYSTGRAARATACSNTRGVSSCAHRTSTVGTVLSPIIWLLTTSADLISP